jgi:hypothetical protein
MKMLYEARIQDLGPGDFVRVECAACGHEELIPRSGYNRECGCRPTRWCSDALPRVRREGEGAGVDQVDGRAAALTLRQ